MLPNQSLPLAPDAPFIPTFTLAGVSAYQTTEDRSFARMVCSELDGAAFAVVIPRETIDVLISGLIAAREQMQSERGQAVIRLPARWEVGETNDGKVAIGFDTHLDTRTVFAVPFEAARAIAKALVQHAQKIASKPHFFMPGRSGLQ